jgi:hypothetical protein
MRSHHSLLALVLTAGCLEAPLPEPDQVTEMSVPLTTLEVLPGVTASFYVWDDLSAGWLLMSKNGSPMLDEELEGLSAAEAFWALSKQDTPVPELLLQHHAALVLDGEHPDWQAVVSERKQGWVLAGPRPRILAACNNATFSANHCALGNGYTATHCFTDHNGNFKTDVFERRRFKAGFCIDHGVETYDSLLWTDYCSNTAALIWLNFFPSNGYGTWEWIAPSSANPRRWVHQGVGWGGAARDWASKWGNFIPECPYEPYL